MARKAWFKIFFEKAETQITILRQANDCLFDLVVNVEEAVTSLTIISLTSSAETSVVNLVM